MRHPPPPQEVPWVHRTWTQQPPLPHTHQVRLCPCLLSVSEGVMRVLLASSGLDASSEDALLMNALSWAEWNAWKMARKKAAAQGWKLEPRGSGKGQRAHGALGDGTPGAIMQSGAPGIPRGDGAPWRITGQGPGVGAARTSQGAPPEGGAGGGDTHSATGGSQDMHTTTEGVLGRTQGGTLGGSAGGTPISAPGGTVVGPSAPGAATGGAVWGPPPGTPGLHRGPHWGVRGRRSWTCTVARCCWI